jgi:two-component system, OmpR family, response regulator
MTRPENPGVFTVLYVEDDADIREVVTVALELTDRVRVIACQTGGQAAVDLARDSALSVILLDVMLPGTDGPKTLELLRADASTRMIPVVFITAKTAQHDLIQLIELGAVGVICKPFDPMTLLQQIQAMIADRHP